MPLSVIECLFSDEHKIYIFVIVHSVTRADRRSSSVNLFNPTYSTDSVTTSTVFRNNYS